MGRRPWNLSAYVLAVQRKVAFKCAWAQKGRGLERGVVVKEGVVVEGGGRERGCSRGRGGA